jgi:hypothetical protein
MKFSKKQAAYVATFIKDSTTNGTITLDQATALAESFTTRAKLTNPYFPSDSFIVEATSSPAP